MTARVVVGIVAWVAAGWQVWWLNKQMSIWLMMGLAVWLLGSMAVDDGTSSVAARVLWQLMVWLLGQQLASGCIDSFEYY